MARAIAVGRQKLGLVGHGILLAGLLLSVNACWTKTRTVVQSVPVFISCLPASQQAPERPQVTHGCPQVTVEDRAVLEHTEAGRRLLAQIDNLELCLDPGESIKLVNYRNKLERTLRSWRNEFCPVVSSEGDTR